MLKSRTNSEAPLRARLKTRRFNSSIFNRPTISDQPGDTFTLSDSKQQYKERRSQAEVLHKRSSKAALTNAILSILSILCAFTDTELHYYGKISRVHSDALRCLLICTSVLQAALAIESARNTVTLLKLLGFKHSHSTAYAASLLFEKQRLAVLLGELTHLCVVLPPGVDVSVTATTRTYTSSIGLADIITIVVTLRLYHVVKYIYSQSPYFLPRAQFYTYFIARALHGVYDSPFFIVMGQMTTHPFLTLFVAGITVLLTSGILYHIVERTAESDLLLYDGPWVIAITQLTVGFGEMPPLTDLGRLVAIGPGILGLCTLSLVVTCAFHQLQLSRVEKKMVEQLYHKDQTQTKLLPLVVIFLQRMWRLRLARKNQNPHRLRELVLYRIMYRIFRAKFAIALNGTNPELEPQIKLFRAKTKREFKSASKRLRPLQKITYLAGVLATENFQFISKVLSCKRAYIRFTRLAIERPRSMSFIPLRRLRGINKTIIYKMNKEIALRKLKERLTEKRSHSHNIVVVNEESISENGSESEDWKKTGRISS